MAARRHGPVTAIALACVSLYASWSLAAPNFVLVLTDDQSWVGSSVRMDPRDPESCSDYFQTPALENLARQGMRFTRGYAPAPFCCPTRRSLQIGQATAQHIYQSDQQQWLANYRQQLTIPQMLKQANPDYRAAHFGKWDMRFDNVSPRTLGYDESDGVTGNRTGGAKGSGGPAARQDPKLAFSLTRRATDFMRRMRDDGHPFYLQISHYAVHLDIYYRAASLAEAQRRAVGKKHTLPSFAAMTGDVDAAIGQLLRAIDALGLTETTYVFFLSDNGGRLSLPSETANVPRNAPLKDGKGSMYEGGIRVPFIVKGPGITPGTVTHVPATGLDLLPTLADFAGLPQPWPRQWDGGSLRGVLEGQAQRVPRSRPYLVFHQAVARKAQSALLQGDFKLVKTWKSDRVELFNLRHDPGEQQDLADQQHERTRKLHQQLLDYLQEQGAATAQTTTKKNQQSSSPREVQAFAHRGGLKMLYDNRMYPQAVQLGPRLHIAWRDSEGLPQLSTYDLSNRQFEPSQSLLAGHTEAVRLSKYRRDHHFAPVLWADPQKHLHVYFGCHKTPGVHLVTATSQSTDHWVKADPIAASVSYPQVHCRPQGQTLVYYRHSGHLGHWGYRQSSDGGRTWRSPPRITVDLNAPPHDAPHASHAGSYHTTALSADGKRLHIAFVWKVEDPLHNQRYGKLLHDHTQRYNLYYLAVDLATGKGFNIHGEELVFPLRKRDADANCLVWDTEERVAAVGPSIALDRADRPHFLLPVSADTPHAAHYYHIAFTKDQWRRTAITETAHPFNASQLQWEEDGTLSAFLIASRARSLQLRGMDEYGWGERVEHWTSPDQGRSWQRAANLSPEPGLHYQNTQFIATQHGRHPRLLLFYGWHDADSPGTAFLWDARP